MSKGFGDTTNASDLATILPGVEVETSIGKVKLVPFRFKDLNKGLELLSRWFRLLINMDGASPQMIIATLAMAVQKNVIYPDGEGKDNKDDEIVGLDVQGDLVQMIQLSLPRKNAVVINQDLQEEVTDQNWIDELTVAEVIELAMEIFELNKSFFTGKLKKFGIQATTVSQNPGQESSLDSSEGVTDSPIS